MVDFIESNDEVQKFDWGEVMWIHEPSKTQFNRLSAGIVRFFRETAKKSIFI